MIRYVLPSHPHVSPAHASRPQRLGLTRMLWAGLLIGVSSAHSSSVAPALLLQLNVLDRHIVEAIPTFAGVYLNVQGVYTVALAGRCLPSQAAVLERYKTLIANTYLLGPLISKGTHATSGVNFAFMQVKYSLLELSAFRTTLEQQSNLLGLAATSLDYEKNRVLVFTSPGQPILDLPSVLIRLNVPSDAAEVWGTLESGWGVVEGLEPKGHALDWASPEYVNPDRRTFSLLGSV